MKEGDQMSLARRWLGRRPRTAIFALMTALAVAAAGLATGASGSRAKPRIAYLSFAVANSYDAPMLAAARAAAKKGGGTVTVFDAANDPKKQFAQLQTVISSKQYDAIVLQPIFGPQLIPLVQQAIKAGIKVVNIDQILGADPGTAKAPVAGMSGNVVFIQTQIGRKQGQLVVRACRANNLNPCNVGYLFSVKVSSLDTAIRKGFDAVIKAVPSIHVVAEGETFYQHAVALKASQTMLEARTDINLVVGADQGATGAEQAKAGRRLVLVGYGGGGVGLKAVKAGRWFGTVMQRPATEGRLGMRCAVAAVKSGKNCGGIDVLKGLPNGGVVTRANASKFKAEWPG
jgi:ribose transport system substrate-binding protein